MPDTTKAAAGRPRMRVYHESEHKFEARYRSHTLRLDRKDEASNWYIVVIADDGGRAYDGWWRDSDGQPINAAIGEALRGACITAGATQ